MPDESDITQYLRGQKKRALAEADKIAQAAKQDVRELTDQERGAANDFIAEAEELDKKIRAREEAQAVQDKVASLGKDLESDPETLQGPSMKGRGLGDAIVASDGYKALLARGVDGGQFSIGPIALPGFAAVSGIVTEDAGDNDEMFLPQRIAGIQGPVEAPLGLAELFGEGIISRGNSVVLVRESVTTNAAATVAEAGPKPASNIQFDTESATLHKIATTIKVSTEMLEDEEAMASYLNGRLATFVRQEEEDQLVTQLLAQAGQTAVAADVEGDNLYDAILAGAVVVRQQGGLDADAVAMTMLDYAKLSVTKTDQGVYYSGGPYAAAGNLLWGRYRVAIVDRLGDGNVVVGAFKQGGTIWRKRGGVSVDATNSNEDDFLNNLTAIRAEERLALFLQRPDAFALTSIES